MVGVDEKWQAARDPDEETFLGGGQHAVVLPDVMKCCHGSQGAGSRTFGSRPSSVKGRDTQWTSGPEGHRDGLATKASKVTKYPGDSARHG